MQLHANFWHKTSVFTHAFVTSTNVGFFYLWEYLGIQKQTLGFTFSCCLTKLSTYKPYSTIINIIASNNCAKVKKVQAQQFSVSHLCSLTGEFCPNKMWHKPNFTCIFCQKMVVKDQENRTKRLLCRMSKVRDWNNVWDCSWVWPLTFHETIYQSTALLQHWVIYFIGFMSLI